MALAVMTNGTTTFVKADLGLVGDTLFLTFEEGKLTLRSDILAAVAHTRYPTEGACTTENTHPFSEKHDMDLLLMDTMES